MNNKRQPRLQPANLTPDQQALYDRIVSGPRKGGPVELVDQYGALRGPFGGFLLSPTLGDALQQLGAAIRYRTDLSPRLRELAILAVAHHESSNFERLAHEAVARDIQLGDDVIAAIAAGQEPPLTDPVELAGLRFTHALLRGDVTDAQWSDLVPVMSVETAYELVVLVGYYSLLALQMRVLRADIT